MPREFPEDIEAMLHQLAAIDADATDLVNGLSEEQAAWRPRPDAWSVAECLDHLGAMNRVYLAAMAKAAADGRSKGRMRQGPARAGRFGRWFAAMMEPPVKPSKRMKAPKNIVQRRSPELRDAFKGFASSQNEVESFLRQSADLDLAEIRFKNPFVWWIRFSLASGLKNILAHDRRHLWQARNVLEDFRRERGKG
jgi:hypothetical protein